MGRYQTVPFRTFGRHFFGVRATGGVGLTIAINPVTGAVTQFCNLLPPIASWSCTSDREPRKTSIPADGKDILQRLAAMPLFSWNFKGADPTIRSLGPTAQDFYAAFGLGRNDKSIANVNMEGVALAAVQGLNVKVDEQNHAAAHGVGECRAGGRPATGGTGGDDPAAATRDRRPERACQKADSLAADGVAEGSVAELQPIDIRRAQCGASRRTQGNPAARGHEEIPPDPACHELRPDKTLN